MLDHDPSTTDQFFTDYCDAEGNWGPLLVFRPRREETLSVVRVLAMSLLLGVSFGLLGDVLLLLAARVLDKTPSSPFSLPAVLTLAYFVVGQLTIAPAWNRRAERLRRHTRR